MSDLAVLDDTLGLELGLELLGDVVRGCVLELEATGAALGLQPRQLVLVGSLQHSIDKLILDVHVALLDVAVAHEAIADLEQSSHCRNRRLSTLLLEVLPGLEVLVTVRLLGLQQTLLQGVQRLNPMLGFNVTGHRRVPITGMRQVANAATQKLVDVGGHDRRPLCIRWRGAGAIDEKLAVLAGPVIQSKARVQRIDEGLLPSFVGRGRHGGHGLAADQHLEQTWVTLGQRPLVVVGIRGGLVGLGVGLALADPAHRVALALQSSDQSHESGLSGAGTELRGGVFGPPDLSASAPANDVFLRAASLESSSSL